MEIQTEIRFHQVYKHESCFAVIQYSSGEVRQMLGGFLLKRKTTEKYSTPALNYIDLYMAFTGKNTEASPICCQKLLETLWEHFPICYRYRSLSQTTTCISSSFGARQVMISSSVPWSRYSQVQIGGPWWVLLKRESTEKITLSSSMNCIVWYIAFIGKTVEAKSLPHQYIGRNLWVRIQICYRYRSPSQTTTSISSSFGARQMEISSSEVDTYDCFNSEILRSHQRSSYFCSTQAVYYACLFSFVPVRRRQTNLKWVLMKTQNTPK